MKLEIQDMLDCCDELVAEIYYWLKERDPVAADSITLKNGRVSFIIRDSDLLFELKLKFL